MPSPAKRTRLINRTVDAIKNLADIKRLLQSDKGLGVRLDNITKVILWNLKNEDRKVVQDAWRAVKKGTRLEDWSEKFWNSTDPLEPLYDEEEQLPADPDQDIYDMLDAGEPLSSVEVEVDKRVKEREIRARLLASQRLKDSIMGADAKTLKDYAFPLMRSGGVLQDKDPPKVVGDAPPKIKIKLNDGGVMELGDVK